MRIDDSDPILRILLIRKRIFFGFSRDVTTTPTRLFRGVDELKKDTLGRFQPFLILLVLLVLAVFVLDLDIERNFEGHHHSIEEQVLEDLLQWEIYTRCTKRELKKRSSEALEHKKRKRGRVLHQTTFFCKKEELRE